MKVYHYARIDDWDEIKRGSWKSKGVPGLGASKRLGNKDEEAFDTSVVWAFLEPLPQSWLANKEFKDTWKIFSREMGNLLLEIEVSDISNAFVVDRANTEGYFNSVRADSLETPVPERYTFSSQSAAERAYLNSRIPLKDYMEKSAVLNYSLPEVIFPNLVPIENIKISEYQPMLDMKWEKEKDRDSGQELIEKISKIPEMRFWLERHRDEIELATENRSKPEFKFI